MAANPEFKVEPGTSTGNFKVGAPPEIPKIYLKLPAQAMKVEKEKDEKPKKQESKTFLEAFYKHVNYSIPIEERVKMRRMSQQAKEDGHGSGSFLDDTDFPSLSQSDEPNSREGSWNEKHELITSDEQTERAQTERATSSAAVGAPERGVSTSSEAAPSSHQQVVYKRPGVTVFSGSTTQSSSSGPLSTITPSPDIPAVGTLATASPAARAALLKQMLARCKSPTHVGVPVNVQPPDAKQSSLTAALLQKGVKSYSHHPHHGHTLKKQAVAPAHMPKGSVTICWPNGETEEEDHPESKAVDLSSSSLIAQTVNTNSELFQAMVSTSKQTELQSQLKPQSVKSTPFAHQLGGTLSTMKHLLKGAAINPQRKTTVREALDLIAQAKLKKVHYPTPAGVHIQQKGQQHLVGNKQNVTLLKGAHSLQMAGLPGQGIQAGAIQTLTQSQGQPVSLSQTNPVSMHSSMTSMPHSMLLQPTQQSSQSIQLQGVNPQSFRVHGNYTNLKDSVAMPESVTGEHFGTAKSSSSCHKAVSLCLKDNGGSGQRPRPDPPYSLHQNQPGSGLERQPPLLTTSSEPSKNGFGVTGTRLHPQPLQARPEIITAPAVTSVTTSLPITQPQVVINPTPAAAATTAVLQLAPQAAVVPIANQATPTLIRLPSGQLATVSMPCPVSIAHPQQAQPLQVQQQQPQRTIMLATSTPTTGSSTVTAMPMAVPQMPQIPTNIKFPCTVILKQDGTIVKSFPVLQSALQNGQLIQTKNETVPLTAGNTIRQHLVLNNATPIQTEQIIPPFVQTAQTPTVVVSQNQTVAQAASLPAALPMSTAEGTFSKVGEAWPQALPNEILVEDLSTKATEKEISVTVPHELKVENTSPTAEGQLTNDCVVQDPGLVPALPAAPGEDLPTEVLENQAVVVQEEQAVPMEDVVRATTEVVSDNNSGIQTEDESALSADERSVAHDLLTIGADLPGFTMEHESLIATPEDPLNLTVDRLNSVSSSSNSADAPGVDSMTEAGIILAELANLEGFNPQYSQVDVADSSSLPTKSKPKKKKVSVLKLFTNFTVKRNLKIE